MTKLLPCPFCGGHAFFAPDVHTKEMTIRHSCYGGTIWLRSPEASKPWTEKQAASAWNSRSHDAVLAYLRERAGDVGATADRLVRDCRDAAQTLAETGTFPTGQSTLREAADALSAYPAVLAQVEAERDALRAEYQALAAKCCGRTGEAGASSAESDAMAGAFREARDGWHRCIAERDALKAEVERLRGAEVAARSRAINDFCAHAGIPMSVEVKSIPDDVRAFRMEAALRAALTTGRGADESGEAGDD